LRHEEFDDPLRCGLSYGGVTIIFIEALNFIDTPLKLSVADGYNDDIKEQA